MTDRGQIRLRGLLDPLYRIRRLLTAAHERISDRGQNPAHEINCVVSSMPTGDPYGEVRTAWHAKETVRGIYGIESPALALRYTHPVGSQTTSAPA